MPWILIGCLAGGLWLLASTYVPVLGAPLDVAIHGLPQVGQSGLLRLLELLGAGPELAYTRSLGALLSVLTPGLVLVVLAGTVRAARASRRTAAVVLVLAAVSSLFFLPPTQALGLVLLALPVALVLNIAGGVAVEAPLAATVVALTGRMVHQVITGTLSFQQTSAQLTGIGGDPTLWVRLLAIAALLPCLAAVLMLLRRR
jgi:hypothetical protein